MSTIDANAMPDIIKEALWCLEEVGASSVIKINLDAVTNNVNVIRKMCPPTTEIMAVVKGGAYGSGLLPVVEVALESGVTALAVATVSEGVYLRQCDITVPIIVLGNLMKDELDEVLLYQLLPSVSWNRALINQPKDRLIYPDGTRLQVNIKLDTGMSRYGVQIQDLETLVNSLDEIGVDIHSIYTHLYSAIDHKIDNKKQFDTFIIATEQYIERGIVRHVAATTGLVQNLGVDLDYVRPGGAITGLCSGNDVECVKQFKKCGFKPSFSVLARPTFSKLVSPGNTIGYDGTYTTKDFEWIVNLTTGWSDGYPRKLSMGIGSVRRLRTGELCPIVGRVSMDSITVKLDTSPQDPEVFQVISDDFDDNTSAVGISRLIGGAVYEVAGHWSTRLPRVYIKDAIVYKVCKSLDYTN